MNEIFIKINISDKKIIASLLNLYGKKVGITINMIFILRMLL